ADRPLQPLDRRRELPLVARFRDELDPRAVGVEARIRAEEHRRMTALRLGEDRRDLALPRRSSSSIETNIASISAGRPGSTQTFSMTKPGAPPSGLASGRAPPGSCA